MLSYLLLPREVSLVLPSILLNYLQNFPTVLNFQIVLNSPTVLNFLTVPSFPNDPTHLNGLIYRNVPIGHIGPDIARVQTPTSSISITRSTNSSQTRLTIKSCTNSSRMIPVLSIYSMLPAKTARRLFLLPRTLHSKKS